MIWRSPVTPVVYLDRIEKARMIRRVLEDFRRTVIESLNILDIGCGNGDISQHFSANNRQFAVDISDRRRAENNAFEFRVVDSERLPFTDGEFDIVISHHVIEHVADQSLHLAEIHRVLRPDGFAYLATPNRGSPFMKGHVGNERVLRHAEMRPLFERHGFQVHEYTVRMLRHPERFALKFRAGALIPLALLSLLRPIIPSHTFVLQARPIVG